MAIGDSLGAIECAPFSVALAQSIFREKGMCAVRGFADAERAAALAAEAERAIASKPAGFTKGGALEEEKAHEGEVEFMYDDVNRPSTLKQIQHLQRLSGVLAAFVDELQPLAAALLGEEASCTQLQWFNKPPTAAYAEGEGSRPTPPHQDGYYWMLEPPVPGLTLWLALDAADEENGCLRHAAASRPCARLRAAAAAAAASSSTLGPRLLAGTRRMTRRCGGTTSARSADLRRPRPSFRLRHRRAAARTLTLLRPAASAAGQRLLAADRRVRARGRGRARAARRAGRSARPRRPHRPPRGRQPQRHAPPPRAGRHVLRRVEAGRHGGARGAAAAHRGARRPARGTAEVRVARAAMTGRQTRLEA